MGTPVAIKPVSSLPVAPLTPPKTGKAKMVLKMDHEIKALLDKAAKDAGHESLSGWARSALVAAAEKQLGRIVLRNWRKAQIHRKNRAEHGWSSMAAYEKWCLEQGTAIHDNTDEGQAAVKAQEDAVKDVPFKA